MGQDKECRANDLQGRTGGATRIRGTNWQHGEDRGKLPHHPVHQVLGRPGQGFELCRGFAVMDVIAREDLENDLVERVADIGDPGGAPILDQDPRVHIRGKADVGRFHRPSGVETRVRRLHREKILQDTDEPSEMRLDPVTACPLPLLHDDLDRPGCIGEIADGEQVWPLENVGDGLRFGGSDEYRALTETIT